MEGAEEPYDPKSTGCSAMSMLGPAELLQVPKQIRVPEVAVSGSGHGQKQGSSVYKSPSHQLKLLGALGCITEDS